MSDVIQNDNPFSSAELDLMRGLAGLMIPASDEYGVPGANDDAIFDVIVTRAKESADGVKAGLHEVEALSRGRHGQDFLALDNETALTLAEDLRDKYQLHLLMSITAQCYYQDDRVLVALAIEPRPPFPQGHEVTQGDWSLLDPVRARKKFYRPV